MVIAGVVELEEKDHRVYKIHLECCKQGSVVVFVPSFINIVHFLFKEVQMNRLSFDQDSRNEADRQLALALNFEYEGLRKAALANNSGISDKALYGAVR